MVDLASPNALLLFSSLVSLGGTPVDSESKDWNQLYQNALLEVDGSKLAERIDLASNAVEARLRELTGLVDDSRQREVLMDALRTLQALRREIP
jgi:hypothetical protein